MRILPVAIFSVLLSLSVSAHADRIRDAQLALNAHNWQAALQILQPLAEQGNADAQEKMAVMYQNGWGVKQDIPEALKLFRIAADKGNSQALIALGWMYKNGNGVPQDDLDADTLIMLGQELARSPTSSQWFSRLDNQQKEAVETKMLKWLREKADAGNVDAQIVTAMRYKQGEGAPKDDAEVYYWFSLAANLVPNNKGNRRAAEGAAKDLTADQKSAVDKRVVDWVRAHPNAMDEWNKEHPYQPTD